MTMTMTMFLNRQTRVSMVLICLAFCCWSHHTITAYVAVAPFHTSKLMPRVRPSTSSPITTSRMTSSITSTTTLSALPQSSSQPILSSSSSSSSSSLSSSSFAVPTFQLNTKLQQKERQRRQRSPQRSTVHHDHDHHDQQNEKYPFPIIQLKRLLEGTTSGENTQWNPFFAWNNHRHLATTTTTDEENKEQMVATETTTSTPTVAYVAPKTTTTIVQSIAAAAASKRQQPHPFFQTIPITPTITTTNTNTGAATATHRRRFRPFSAAMSRPARRSSTSSSALNHGMLRTLQLSQVVTILFGLVTSCILRSIVFFPEWCSWRFIASEPGLWLASLLDWHTTPALHQAWRHAATTAASVSSVQRLLLNNPWMALVWKGVVGTIPLIALSRFLESNNIMMQQLNTHTSRRQPAAAAGRLMRATHYVSFSTTNMVMALFGKRLRQSLAAQEDDNSEQKQHQQASAIRPPTESTTTTTSDMLKAATRLCLMTAVSEELIFRGLLPATLYSILPLPLAVPFILQALLFGLGHANPSATSPSENRLVVAWQTLNGLWYAYLYQSSVSLAATAAAAAAASSSSASAAALVSQSAAAVSTPLPIAALFSLAALVPSLVSHFLYDLHALTAAWHITNNQVEYTEEQTTTTKTAMQQQQAIDEIKREFNLYNNNDNKHNKIDETTVAACRRFFFAFDSHHVQQLSLSDVQRAISYAFLPSQGAAAVAIQPPSMERVQQVFHEQIEWKQKQQKQQQKQQQSHSQDNSLTSVDNSNINKMKDLLSSLPQFPFQILLSIPNPPKLSFLFFKKQQQHQTKTMKVNNTKQQQQPREDRLAFPEFLRLLLTLRTQAYKEAVETAAAAAANLPQQQQQQHYQPRPAFATMRAREPAIVH